MSADDIAILPQPHSACFALAVHLASVAVAIVRCRPRAPSNAAAGRCAADQIIRPVCGIDNFVEDDAALGVPARLSALRDPVLRRRPRDDPVVPLVRSLIAEHPHVDARLLIGDERISDNPKLNNVLKGWRAAAHDWIVIADSNVLMPRDYMQRLLARWRPDTGLVCSPPIGCRAATASGPKSNARSSTPIRRAGSISPTRSGSASRRARRCSGAARSRTRRRHPRAGGRSRRGRRLDQDRARQRACACAWSMRRSGSRSATARAVESGTGSCAGRGCGAPASRLSTASKSSRARCCRSSPPSSSPSPPAIRSSPRPPLFLVLWYGAEMLLAARRRLARSRCSIPLHAMLRDVLLPVLWVEGWRGAAFVWRGNAMSVDEGNTASNEAGSAT